jgi:hypothetical protein
MRFTEIQSYDFPASGGLEVSCCEETLAAELRVLAFGLDVVINHVYEDGAAEHALALEHLVDLVEALVDHFQLRLRGRFGHQRVKLELVLQLHVRRHAALQGDGLREEVRDA